LPEARYRVDEITPDEFFKKFESFGNEPVLKNGGVLRVVINLLFHVVCNTNNKDIKAKTLNCIY
jgi:hypothetical protein